MSEHKRVPTMTAFVEEQGKGQREVNWDEHAYRRHYRRICAPAAVRSILGANEFIKSYYFSHRLERLPLHLPGDDPVVIRGRGEGSLQDALDKRPISKLLAYFDLVKSGRAPNLLYKDVVRRHTWSGGRWNRIKTTTTAIGMLIEIQPSNTELYALYLLLRNDRSRPSTANLTYYIGYDYLRTYDGQQYPTFADACMVCSQIHSFSYG